MNNIPINSPQSENEKISLKKLLIDKLSYKLRLLIIISTILLILIIRIILFFAAPEYFLPLDSDISCPSDYNNYEGLCQDINLVNNNKWVSVIKDFSSKDQFIVVQGNAIRNFEMSGVYENFNFNYKTRFMNFGENDEDTHVKEEEDVAKIYFYREKIISEPYDFFFHNNVESGDYKIEIHLDIDENDKKFLEGFKFTVYKGNYKTTSVILGVRYTLFVLSVISFIIYLINFIKVAKDFRTFEHNMIFVLSISLIFFNDPFIALILKNPTSKFWSVLSTFFIVQFVSILFYFFLILAKRYDREEKNVSTKVISLIEKIGISILFLFLLITACVYNTDQNSHPAYFKENDSIFFLVLVILTALLVLSYWITTLFIICKAISKFRNLLIRQKFLLIVSLIVLIFLVFNLITGFYHHFSLTPGRTITYFLSLNLFVYILQILWRFIGGEIIVEKIDPKNKKVEIKVTFEDDDEKQDFPNPNNQFGHLKLGKQDLYKNNETIDYEKEKKKEIFLKDNVENINLKTNKKKKLNDDDKSDDEDEVDQESIKDITLLRRKTYEFNN